MDNKEESSLAISLASVAEQRMRMDASEEEAAIRDQASFSDGAAGDEPLFVYPAGYKPREYDVICGRTNNPNLELLKMVREHMGEYAKHHKCRLRKSAIVSKIHDKLVFLKLDDTTQRYHVVPTSQARAKIGLTFRLELAQKYPSNTETRIRHQRKHRLMPTGFEPRETDIPIVDEKGESHPGQKVLEVRLQELLPAFSAGSTIDQRLLVSKLYREFREEGRLFLDRRAREGYRWHRLSQYMAHVEIRRLFRSKVEAWTLREWDTSKTATDSYSKRKSVDEPNKTDTLQLVSDKSSPKGRLMESAKEQTQKITARWVPQEEINHEDSVDTSGRMTKEDKEKVYCEKAMKEACFPNGKDVADAEIQAWQVVTQSQFKPGEVSLESVKYMNLHLGESLGEQQHNGKLQVKAVERLQHESNQGHADAQFTLARCFHDGIGMKQNLTKAAALYCQAAAQFHVNAGNQNLPDEFLISQVFMFSHHAA